MITTADAWICYSVQWLYNDHWETPYVGACPAAQFTQLPDANRNSLFAEMISPNSIIRVIINGAFADEANARLQQTLIIHSLPVVPHFNTNGTTIEPRTAHKRGGGQSLRNLTNGDIYRNGAEAAASLGVTPSAISKHINGGLANVAGCQLERL